MDPVSVSENPKTIDPTLISNIEKPLINQSIPKIKSKSSSSKSISPSKHKKKKNKKKKSPSHSRSRSRSRSINRKSKTKNRKRSSSHRKKSKKNHKRRNERSKTPRSKSPSSSIKEQEIERKRSRTRSPPRFFARKNKSPGMLNIMDIDAAKPKYFWDGFQWVAKTNSVPNIDPNILNQTRKMRKVQISNLPLYMGLTENDIKQIVSKFLIDNFLNDVGNFTPVVSVTLNHQGNYAVLEVSSVEETNRLIKIESIKIFNQNCKITRVGESMYGQTLNLQTLVTNAQVKFILFLCFLY